jgi:hypothetical protein
MSRRRRPCCLRLVSIERISEPLDTVRSRLTNVTVSDSLKFAFGITNDAQIAGPDSGWADFEEPRCISGGETQAASV